MKPTAAPLATPLAAPRAAGTTPAAATPALVALFCVLWSSAFVSAKIAVVDCPPLLLLSVRFLLAGAILLVGCALTGRLKLIPRRELAMLAVSGVLNNAVYLGFSFVGMVSVSSGFAAVIISANPLLVAFLAGPVLGEHLTRRKLLGLVLGLLGVAIVLRSRIAGGHEDVVGMLFILAALVALSAGTLVYKRVRTSADLFMASGVQSLAGGLALLPLALATESLGAVNLTPALAGSFAYLVLGVSVGGYSLWYFILGRASATEASALHFLMPPLGLLFGWLLLGEHVPWLDLAGIVPIALGIRLVTR